MSTTNIQNSVNAAVSEVVQKQEELSFVKNELSKYKSTFKKIMSHLQPNKENLDEIADPLCAYNE